MDQTTISELNKLHIIEEVHWYLNTDPTFSFWLHWHFLLDENNGQELGFSLSKIHSQLTCPNLHIHQNADKAIESAFSQSFTKICLNYIPDLRVTTRKRRYKLDCLLQQVIPHRYVTKRKKERERERERRKIA